MHMQRSQFNELYDDRSHPRLPAMKTHVLNLHRHVTMLDDEFEPNVGGSLLQAHAQIQSRRKGIGVRAWLVISESGESRLEEVGKHSIMQRTGLPPRDLRALDPMLSYPSSILGRERSIVINLEHIKAIITPTEVLMLNSSNPLVVQFVEELQYRILMNNASPNQVVMHDYTDMETTIDVEWNPSQFSDQRALVKCSSKKAFSSDRSPEFKNQEKDEPGANQNTFKAGGSKVLPFEFRALEACLESACKCFESETRTLEEEAYPALDELTSKISNLTLERVRQIKSRLVALSGRVQKVRDELEHLLDDENDMAEMYLTEKITPVGASQTSLKVDNIFDNKLDGDDDDIDDDKRDDGAKSDDCSDICTIYKPNVEELEMLLEAYFAQIDGILQKLSHMSEYVGDTEDFINIMLDDKQNQLLHMGVMLSTANMVINAGIVVVGLFGMNIHIPLFDGKTIQFWQTVIGTLGGSVALYLTVFGWAKKKNFLAL